MLEITAYRATQVTWAGQPTSRLIKVAARLWGRSRPADRDLERAKLSIVGLPDRESSMPIFNLLKKMENIVHRGVLLHPEDFVQSEYI